MKRTMSESPEKDLHIQFNDVELPASVEIKESQVSIGKPGAFCKTYIKKDTRFGPYKGEIINPGQKAEIDYRYAWEVFEKRRNVLKFTISALDPKTSNWMRNVNCARFYEEQNIISTQEGFSIFYIAMKDIKPGEELLTWFDPQLLKRTKRRMSRGERRKVGYTIELVPWSDEKKFVPEIIDTKRARKKKLLGEDMLCFQEDAALMQRSLNSMFRLPRKPDSVPQPTKIHGPSQHHIKNVSNFKNNGVTSVPLSFAETKRKFMSQISASHTSETLTISEPCPPAASVTNGNVAPKKCWKPSEGQRDFSDKHFRSKLKDAERKTKQFTRRNSVKAYMEKLKAGSKDDLDSNFGFNPNDPNLLKPIIIRTKDNGMVEIEDHDEIYVISSKSVRQDCDDLCQCIDKKELMEQKQNTSSSLEKRNQEVFVHFSLLPEHQKVTDRNKVIYKCDICDSSYNHGLSLKRHYLGIHINHRYLSNKDIEQCHLETFHGGVLSMNDESEKDLKSTMSDIKISNISSSCSQSLRTCSSLENNENVQKDMAKSLFCNESLLDSDFDNMEKGIPSLKELAHSQINACNTSKGLPSYKNINSCEDQSKDTECNASLSTHKERITDSSNGDKNTKLTVLTDESLDKAYQSTSTDVKLINQYTQGERDDIEKMTEDLSAGKEDRVNNFTTQSNERDSSQCKNEIQGEESYKNNENKELCPSETLCMNIGKVEKLPDVPSLFNGTSSNENELLKDASPVFKNEKAILDSDNDLKLCEGELVLSNEKTKEGNSISEKNMDQSPFQNENYSQEPDSILVENDKEDPTVVINNTIIHNEEVASETNTGTDQKVSEKVNKTSSEKLSTSQKLEVSCVDDKEDPTVVINNTIIHNEEVASETNTGTDQKVSEKVNKTSSEKLSTSQKLEVSCVETAVAKSPLAQKQFLLLLPILSPNSQMCSKPSDPVSINSSFLPQADTAMPLVVLSQQVASELKSTQSNIEENHLKGPSNSTQPGVTSLSQSSPNSCQSSAFISNTNTSIAKTLISSWKSAVKESTTQKMDLSPPSALMPDVKAEFTTVDEADHPADLYRCHMCVLVYKSMEDLKHHIRNDPHRFKGGLKQYACSKCSVRFRNKANLAKHRMIHHERDENKDRKHRCLTCGKGFTSETYLKMHERFHLGKSFPCKYGCKDTFFPNAGTLVKHLRSVHPGLDLKEYLREKARRERLHRYNLTGNDREYSIDHPGVGFQAKRGRPKGSKNIPKELKLLTFQGKSSVFLQEPSQSVQRPVTVPTKEPILKKKSFSGQCFAYEKSWYKGTFMFPKESSSTSDETEQHLNFHQRQFNCKLCDASFLSYLYLLKHCTKRHGTPQSVQEFLFEMAKDNERPNHLEGDPLQFSPPPSPKTFFANVNSRGAENLSKYIDGGAKMLKSYKTEDFDMHDSQKPILSTVKLEWTHYNFHPSFSYVRDRTVFYINTEDGSTMRNITENLANSVEGSYLVKEEKTESLDDVSSLCANLFEISNQSNPISAQGVETDDVNESSANICKAVINDLVMNLQVEKIEKVCHGHLKDNTEHQEDSRVLIGDELCQTKGSPSPPLNQNLLPTNQCCHTPDDSNPQPSHERETISEANMKKFCELKIGLQDFVSELRKFSVKSLNLEVNVKHLYSNFKPKSVLDGLDLVANEMQGKSSVKLPQNKHKRERHSSISSLSSLSHLFLKLDQRCSALSNFPDVTKHEPRRYSIWQGSHYNKEDKSTTNEFCCPVVESVRQQTIMKDKKEIQKSNEKQKIIIHPRQKNKEDFASSMGLMSRREFERSYHALDKKERCIKPPEIWERYNHIWFGKKGTITVVCSICHRHFSCVELCLRHQLKKHPHIEPSLLEMERDNYVEDMYYYYPMPYGILAQTQLIPENLPALEVYVCTRCKFPFKNLNKLHAHIILCDPNNTVSKNPHADVERSQSVDLNTSFDKKVHENEIPNDACKQPPRQRLLTSKYKEYQMIEKYPVVSTLVDECLTTRVETRPFPLRSTGAPMTTHSKSYVSFSGLPRRKRNQHGLLYNPSNHIRRREAYQVLDQHQCLGCNLKFKSMSMLERHVKKCSGKDKLKNQKPLLSGTVDEMMMRKQHTCRYCNKRFTFIKGVDLHYKRVCSIRKIREEENQLTEEDLSHEAELERIIEHLVWSKSLNKDSSDIIQGNVRVEEDGTLTRVDKKRGRPFGTGKRMKKKGFKWTTLKHHVHKQDNESALRHDPSQTSESIQGQSIDTNKFNELSQEGLNLQMPKKFAEISGIYGDKTGSGGGSNDSQETIPPKKKRGRPFKNRDSCVKITSIKSNRKRGRPRIRKESIKPVSEHTEVLSLKDSINLKREEAVNKKLFDHRKGKCSLSSKEHTAAQQHQQCKANEFKQPHAKEEESALSHDKRKIKDDPSRDVMKPPARKRGRPKKFDPSDMESSYKKKKKTDPSYVSCIRKTSIDKPKDEGPFESTHVKVVDPNSLSESKDIYVSPLQIKPPQVNSDKITAPVVCDKQVSPKAKDTESNVAKLNAESQPPKYSQKKMNDKYNRFKENKNCSIVSSEKIFKSDITSESDPSKLSVKNMYEDDVKKRKIDTVKACEVLPKRTKLDDIVKDQFEKTDVQHLRLPSSGKEKNVSQEKHDSTPSLSSSFIEGNNCQTPVAVRIVTLPASDAQHMSPVSSMKIARAENTSLTITSSSKTASTSTGISTPTASFSPAQSSLLKKPIGTSCIVLTTKTHTTTSAAVAKTTQGQIIRPSTFPVAQVIPIENGKLLIPPQAVQAGMTSRFIIHSTPMKTLPGQQGVGKNIPVSVRSTNSQVRHVTPSTVLLTSGKVTSIAGTVVTGSQQGKKVTKVSNVIYSPPNDLPVVNQSQTISSPPKAVSKQDDKTVSVSASATASPSPGVATAFPRPFYYLQTSPLSNQAVHGLKTGVQIIPVSVVHNSSRNSNLNIKNDPMHQQSSAAVIEKNDGLQSQEN